MHQGRPNSCSRGLKILTWNMEGYKTKNTDYQYTNKFNINYVKSMFNLHDIICVTETWTNVNTECNISLQGYKSFCLSRTDKHVNANRDSGGIAVLIKNDILKYVQRQPSLDINSIWFKLDKSFCGTIRDIYIGAIYIPPEYSSSHINSTLDDWDMLEKEISFFQNKGSVLLCGDFNSRTGTQQDYIFNDSCDTLLSLPSNYIPDRSDVPVRCNLDEKVNNYGRKLIDFCIGKRLHIINGRTQGDFFGNFTCLKYNGCSTVDYNIINKDMIEYVKSFQVLQFSELSDHKPLSLELDMNIQEFDIDSDDILLSDVPGKYIFNDDSKIKYRNTLLHPETQEKINCFLDNSFSPTLDGIDKAVDEFTNILKDSARKSARFVKPKMRKEIPKPWFDANCFEARKNFNFVKKLYDKYPHKREIRESYYRHARYYKKLKNNKKTLFKDDILESMSRHGSASNINFWDKFKRLDLQKEPETNLISPKSWYDYYKNLNKCTIETTSQDRDNLLNKENLVLYNRDLDNDITISELKQCISKLKLKKSGGSDLINNEMIKYGKDILAGSLQKLFNVILHSGIYPTKWKGGLIVNIFKSGNRSDPSNYRGITLTSVLGKLLSSIINNRLVNLLDERKLMSEFQAGFRKDHRTTDHIFVLHKTMNFYKDKGKNLYLAFIDFHKAFDKLWRHGLLLKLCEYGIGGNMYSLIKSMYHDNISKVRVNNKCTPHFPCNSGVRQGDSLSPTLFNIFVNDITNILSRPDCDPAKIDTTSVGCMFYADDLVLLSESRDGLQTGLDALHNYCQKWHLSVNQSKTKVMIVQKNRSYVEADVTLDGNSLEQVHQYKYLGLTFCENAKLDVAQETLYKKALKAYYAMSNMLYSAKRMNSKNFLVAFEALVKPILMYGCEIWAVDSLQNKKCSMILSGQKVALKAEKLELKLLKYLLAAPKNASNVAVRSEFGRLPLRFYALSQILKFYYRLKIGCKNVLLVKVFNALSDATVNPFSQILTTLVECNMKLYVPQIRQNIKAHVKKSLESLDDPLYEQWDADIYNNRKLTTYSTIKESHDLEGYIININDRFLRKYLSMLRLSCHPLKIETGRYRKIPQELRLCDFCNLNEVESEYHMIMRCSLYNNLRDNFFSMYSNFNNERWNKATSPEEKFRIVMQPNDTDSAIHTCQFIKSCFTLRKNKEYS